MRIGGIILYILFLIPTALGIASLPIFIIIKPSRFKESIRAIDQFNNAFWLNGSGRESVSSHSWRARDSRWAKFVIWLTDLLQKGHCEEANKHEQPVADFIDKNG